MEEIALLELAQKGLTIISPAIQGIMSAWIATVFLRKNAQATELEKLKAGKVGEAIGHVLQSGKMTLLELYKCRNILEVVKVADEAILSLKSENTRHNQNNEEEEVDETARNINSEENFYTQPDFDWIMRFFDAVGNISNDDLQNLWGKVLAGEATHRGSCSLRTLDLLRNMSSDEAKIFLKMMRLVVISGNCYFVIDEGFQDNGNAACKHIIEEGGLVYTDHVRVMIDCGLMAGDSVDIATHFSERTPLYVHNSEMIAIFKSRRPLRTPFTIGSYSLTSSGIELYEILQKDPTFSPNVNYFLTCLRHLQGINKKVTISAHKLFHIDRSNDPQFDQCNLLKDG